VQLPQRRAAGDQAVQPRVADHHGGQVQDDQAREGAWSVGRAGVELAPAKLKMAERGARAGARAGAQEVRGKHWPGAVASEPDDEAAIDAPTF
jgi:hypothetical protein